MAEALDRVRQQLIQSPLPAQVSALYVVLLVVGGFVASVLVGAIGVVSSRLWQGSVRRRERSQELRGADSESQPIRQWPADSSPEDPKN